MANIIMGTMMVTRMLERTRSALALISWLGSCRRHVVQWVALRHFHLGILAHRGKEVGDPCRAHLGVLFCCYLVKNKGEYRNIVTPIVLNVQISNVKRLNVRKMWLVNADVPSTLAERWKWRAERGPAAPRHNAPSKRRRASSPIQRKGGGGMFNPNYVDYFNFFRWDKSEETKWRDNNLKKTRQEENCYLVEVR